MKKDFNYYLEKVKNPYSESEMRSQEGMEKDIEKAYKRGFMRDVTWRLPHSDMTDQEIEDEKIEDTFYYLKKKKWAKENAMQAKQKIKEFVRIRRAKNKHAFKNK